VTGCALGVIFGICIPFAAALTAGLAMPSFFARQTEKQLQAPPITAGYKANYNWTLRDVQGEEVPFEQFKGKAVFLHFWNPTCLTCLAEVPSINNLYNEAGVYGVEFVAVTGAAHAEDLAAVVDRESILTPVYTVTDQIPPVFQAPGAPATYIIAPNGDVVFMHVGGAKWDDARAAFLLRQLAEEGGGSLSRQAETIKPS
jgi:thiol-disulfide isomerase/thioredoxin